MKSLTIGQRVYALVGFLALVIIGVSAFAVLRINSIRATSESITSDSLPGIITAAAINRGIADNQIRVNLLLRAETPEKEKAIEAEIAEQSRVTTAAVADYEKTIFVEKDRQNFEKFKALRRITAKSEKFISPSSSTIRLRPRRCSMAPCARPTRLT